MEYSKNNIRVKRFQLKNISTTLYELRLGGGNMSWKEICKITNSLPKEEKNLICPSDEKTMSTPRNFIGDHIIYVKNKPIGFIAIFSYPLNWQETKFSKRF